MKEDFLELLESKTGGQVKSQSFSRTGLLISYITGGTALALSVICLPFISPAFRRVCLPYVPATTTQVQNVMKALEGKSGKVIDLGSGDGRIVISAAQNGFSADGVELNLLLVLYSRLRALRLGLSKKTSFFRQDLWKFKITPYQNVVIFGVEEMMPELEEKCHRELHNNANVIACRFPLSSLKPSQEIGSGIDSVWVYKIVK
ncbi:unnamed protein product [Bemisia tabaci]|uniref:Uncharacterized protein n=1 Tax=Bemisia tabaci TaxID=7038 RepID=A0A9P0AA37_BEMTA|nr:PREDICTED: protein FAM173B [Bemisia tabaci]CAH0389909.1 unnamed protein product [Bemisia tabaci]